MPDLRPLLAVVPALVLAACGESDPPARDPVPLTPERIAEVVADHVGREPRDVAAWDVMTRELGVESPGAFLPIDRRVTLRVAVAPTTDHPLVCADESFYDACVELGSDGHGGRVVLGWQELQEEEDPGVVYVIDRRDGEDVVVGYSGTSIEGDPRELDLGVTVEQLAEIATDERLTLG